MENKIDNFLEENNMTYLFLLLANLEVERLNNLPYTVKKQIKGKLTNIALEHVAENIVPDYVMLETEETEEIGESDE
ncbi:MAG TPA: hypothetical protein PLD62_06520 [Candidatus Cloacimonadota bacterium]|nr:hypothetical protein [Candidatus Cloacimonadota bacterium]